MTPRNTPTAQVELLEAIANVVTDRGGRRVFIRKGRTYAVDAPEVAIFGRDRFVRFGAGDEAKAAAVAQLRIARNARIPRHVAPKAEPPTAPAATVAIARRQFRSGDRVVKSGARLALTDPAVTLHPQEFRFEVDRHAGRGPLLIPGIGTLAKALGRR